MKTLRELCEEFGVTRRTIQWYEEKGLIKPEGKTKSKHLLYGQEASNQLAAILILKDAGYDLDSIKVILDNPPPDFFDILLDSLENQKKKVQGMINLVRSWKPLDSFTTKYLEDLSKVVRIVDFKKNYDRFVNYFSEMDDDEMEMIEILEPFFLSLILIGKDLKMPFNDPIVQSDVNKSYLDMKRSLIEEDEKLDEREEIEFFHEITEELFRNPDIIQIYGNEFAEYIRNSIKYFCENSFQNGV